MVLEPAKTVLGQKKCTNENWFDKNDSAIRDLLAKKNKAFTEWQNDPGCIPQKEIFKSLQAQAQWEIWRMHNQWWTRKAKEVQHFADTNNLHHFLSSIKSVSGYDPLLSADGTKLIKVKSGISNRWREHFC